MEMVKKFECPFLNRPAPAYVKELDDYIESAAMCSLVDKWCLMENGGDCDIYLEELARQQMLDAEADEMRDIAEEEAVIYEQWKEEQKRFYDSATSETIRQSEAPPDGN